MGDKARMPFEPSLHLGMLVRAIVVHHQVQGHLARKLLVQTAQKFQKLLMPMPLVALADDPALQDFQGGKQGSRAIACSRASWCRSGLSSGADPVGCGLR